MRLRSVLLFVFVFAIVSTVSQDGQKPEATAAPADRHALVIGNANYKVGRLKNPVNDADDMAAQLSRLGFQTTKLTDANQQEMENAINAFGRKLQGGGVGLFFFAGHGVQVGGFNYLIPVGANIDTEGDVKYFAVNANRVLSKMQDAGNPLNMVFLDACRNNPFSRRFRSALQGLAPMDAPRGSLVAYATAPGDVAADGGGRNGVFTKNLLEQMARPGVEVGPMLRLVNAGVQRETGGEQTPFVVHSLTGNFYFNQSAGATSGTGLSSADTPPPLPQEPSVSFDSFFQSSKKEQEAQERWENWLTARQDNFEKVKQLDSDKYLSAEKKADAWRIFLDAVSQNNPNSSQDEQMRDYATSRQNHWQDEASRTKPTREEKLAAAGLIASTNVSTKLREVSRDGQYIAYDDGDKGVVLDTKTNLMWAAKDNGKDIDWYDANRYCENYRGGGYTDWRMPTLDELAGLYDGGIEGYDSACVILSSKSKLKLTSFICLSCLRVWTSEKKKDWGVFLEFEVGRRNSLPQEGSFTFRALPVREGN